MDSGYAELISRFNWVEFYEQYSGIIESFRNLVASKYAYVLIDSRTGFTDVSGVCTMLLPEKLVTVFTPNRQSLSGVLDLTRRATEYRCSSNDFRPLSVFPLPSRIENAEQVLKRDWRKQYQQDFEWTFQLVYQLQECDLTAYFDEVQLPHVGYYAYGENLALLEERSDALSLSRSYETFFQQLIGLDYPWDNRQAIESASTVSPAAEPSSLPSEIAPTRNKELVLGTAEYSIKQPADRLLTKAESYEVDIYISYAHIDNLSMLGGQKGWVDLLHERLDIRLTQLLGKRVNIWRDQKLSGNDLFHETLALRVSKSALFLAVVSPRYVQSEWCLRELEEFLSTNDRIGSRSRVLKVMKIDVPLHMQPAQLKDVLGYQFYQRDQSTARIREFDYELSANGTIDARYWEKLEELAWNIKELIGRLSADPSDRTEQVLPLTGTVVYLAETTSDLNEERDKVRRELQRFGHIVLPDKPLPLQPRPLRETVWEYLTRSRMSIHMIGEHYGLIPEGEEHSVVSLQQELAAERAGETDFSQIIWMPLDLRPNGERQERFVLDLQNNLSSNNDSELIQAGVEDLKTIILAKLAEKARDISAIDAAKGVLRVYLICDRQDVDDVEPLQNYLFDQGYDVILPLLEANDAEAIQDHKDNLRFCDAVLIYQGHASEAWLQMKLRDLLKLPGYGRSTQLLSKVVYIGPPETLQKERFRTHEAVVIKNYGDFSSTKLKTLFIPSK